MIFHHAFSYGWLISSISLLHQDDNTDPEIDEEESEDPGESTSSSNTEDVNLHHEQEVLPRGHARRDKLLRATSVAQPRKRSDADSVIAHPPLPNSRNPAGALAPPLLKPQNSTLLNKLS